MMKTILVLAAAMGLSVSVAAAECAAHKQVNASVDTQTKVASVVKQAPAQEAQSTKAEETKAE
jgi:hypothetical protein